MMKTADKKRVLDRYHRRDAARTERCRKIEELGILKAAGFEDAVARAAHMTPTEGRALSRRGPANAAGEGRRFEAIIGGFDDSDHVNFLHRGVRAARAVCRLSLDGAAVGTGFLVAPGLILTNNHVISGADDAARFIAEFDYELDIDDQPRRPIARFELSPDEAFVTSDADEGLDFTFVAVRARSLDQRANIETFGWLPMDERRGKILEGEPVVIIQHPRGESKRVCLFAAELVDRFEDYLHYTTDTDGGSSGSPAFNRAWQLVGLHHAAVPTGSKRRGQDSVVNEGIRVSSIVGELEKRGAAARAVLARVTDPAVLGDGRPQSPGVVAVMADAADDIPSTARVKERTRILTRPADFFSTRDPEHFGYKPDFLGIPVPLPMLPPALKKDAARLADGTTVLHYTHYSAVHSASRRVPMLTAVNIHGEKSRRLARTDRDFEAADKWYQDPRIDASLQLGPEIYDGTPFDFGHMVRREDPVWADASDPKTAVMANDDTFYMTNCVPQHSDLNQKTWLALENAVLDSARENKVKLSVFTGPVLSPQDQTIRGVQVPNAFWKIVAYVADGQLHAHGFMQWQTDLVDDVRRDLEGFDQLQKAAEYVVPIADIARDSSLDFGPLLGADTPLDGHESARRRLTPRIVELLQERIGKADPARDEVPAVRRIPADLVADADSFRPSTPEEVLAGIGTLIDRYFEQKA